jgi:hypothetical protein
MGKLLSFDDLKFDQSTALVYFDRENSPITRERWQELLRTPEYVDLGRFIAPVGVVEYSWVGVSSSRLSEHKIFCVRIKTSVHIDVIEEWEYSWCQSEAEAKNCYDSLCRELMPDFASGNQPKKSPRKKRREA